MHGPTTHPAHHRHQPCEPTVRQPIWIPDRRTFDLMATCMLGYVHENRRSRAAQRDDREGAGSATRADLGRRCPHAGCAVPPSAFARASPPRCSWANADVPDGQPAARSIAPDPDDPRRTEASDSPSDGMHPLRLADSLGVRSSAAAAVTPLGPSTARTIACYLRCFAVAAGLPRAATALHVSLQFCLARSVREVNSGSRPIQPGPQATALTRLT